jgi:hypothetical protein
MATVEVSRTLVKSPPELWAELQGERLSEAVGDVSVRPTEAERALTWEGQGARGTAVLEPSGWGTKVTLTAEIEERIAKLEVQAARLGLWARLRSVRPAAPGLPVVAPEHEQLEERLEKLLDDLGSAHRKPFGRE